MELDLAALRQEDFWRQAWEQTRKSSPQVRRKIREEKEAIEFWNHMAPKYGQHHAGKGQERIEKVICSLEESGMLTPEAEVLDVGCGPGTYALPFTGRCKSVTALDGAREMCRILKEKVAEAGLSNVKVLQHMWEDVDLEKEGLLNRFDLVFASMTPAVSDYETFLKLNQASRKYCCLISWAGGSFNEARRDLWELLFYEKDESRGHHTFYQINLLFSMGYYPTISYFDSYWVNEETVEEAIESLCRSFWHYTEITPQVKDTIAGYVKEKCTNGFFRQETRARLSMMTWRVDEPCMP